MRLQRRLEWRAVGYHRDLGNDNLARYLPLAEQYRTQPAYSDTVY